MNAIDKTYLDLLKDILNNGVEKDTRAGRVKSVFGRQLRFELKKGLPLLTTKKVFILLDNSFIRSLHIEVFPVPGGPSNNMFFR